MSLPECSVPLTFVFLPIRGEPWQVKAEPGRLSPLLRELVLGPGAPEFGSPNSFFPENSEGMEAETLEVHSVLTWQARGGFPKLLLVLDGEGIGKGLKPNQRASFILNGGADPGMDASMIVHGPACIVAEKDGDGEDTGFLDFDKDELQRLLRTRGKGSVDSVTWDIRSPDGVTDTGFFSPPGVESGSAANEEIVEDLEAEVVDEGMGEPEEESYSDEEEAMVEV
ncbi:hypothetical protein DFJ74DRAFT_680306 [Hyaloraphidium curvatum]|nr:hypothetical protein DFJ74DRAFT_680306 [Hyaloraphidium curvatum]